MVEAAAESTPQSGLSSDVAETSPHELDAEPSVGAGVFIELPEDRRLAEQRERTSVLLDRGALVLGLVSLVLLVIAAVQTAKGAASLGGWLAPFVTAAIAFGAYYLLQHVSNPTSKEVEVPEVLGPPLAEALEDRAAVLEDGDRVLEDEDYLEATRVVDELFKDAVESARLSLEAERGNQWGDAKRHAVEARASAQEIFEIHDEIFTPMDDEVIEEEEDLHSTVDESSEGANDVRQTPRDDAEYTDESSSIVRPDLAEPESTSEPRGGSTGVAPVVPPRARRGTVYRPQISGFDSGEKP